MNIYKKLHSYCNMPYKTYGSVLFFNTCYYNEMGIDVNKY